MDVSGTAAPAAACSSDSEQQHSSCAVHAPRRRSAAKSAGVPDATKFVLADFSARTSRHGLVYLLSHATAIAVSTTLLHRAHHWHWYSGGGGWAQQLQRYGGGYAALVAVVVLTLLQGVLLSHLYMPFHETCHNTCFASSRMNDVVGWLVGCAAGFNSTDFRHFHRAHHKHTQREGFDPELPGANFTLGNYLHKLLGGEMRLAVYFLLHTAWHGAGPPFVPPSDREHVTRSVRAQVLVYASLVCCSAWARSAAAFWYWLLPLALGQPVLWGQFIAQHSGCDFRPQEDDSGFDVDGRYSRTTITNSVYCALSWNMPFHGVHHMYPKIPFHQLPRAHRVLDAAACAKYTSQDGYLGVHRRLVARALKGTAKA